LPRYTENINSLGRNRSRQLTTDDKYASWDGDGHWTLQSELRVKNGCILGKTSANYNTVDDIDASFSPVSYYEKGEISDKLHSAI
jgi:hypothetical protein